MNVFDIEYIVLLGAFVVSVYKFLKIPRKSIGKSVSRYRLNWKKLFQADDNDLCR